MASLNEVQTNLDHAGIAVQLTPDVTSKIAQVTTKDMFAQAAAKAAAKDQGARGWVLTKLQEARVPLEEGDGAATSVRAGGNGTSSAQAPSGPNGGEQPISYPSPNAVAGGNEPTPEKPPMQHDEPPMGPPPGDAPPPAPPVDEPRSGAPQRNESTEAGNRRPQHKVFGKKAALTIEADTTRREQIPTIAIDAAQAQGERNYDWSNKIRLQLTSRELPVFAAVLLGVRTKFEAKNHGEGSNKGMTIERQESGFFVRVFQGDEGVRALPMGAEDAFHVGSLVLRQLKAANPGLDDTALLALIRTLFQ